MRALTSRLVAGAGFNVETVEHKRHRYTMWDITTSGHDNMRPLFRHYIQSTSAVFFLVDSNERGAQVGR